MINKVVRDIINWNFFTIKRISLFLSLSLSFSHFRIHTYYYTHFDGVKRRYNGVIVHVFLCLKIVQSVVSLN